MRTMRTIPLSVVHSEICISEPLVATMLCATSRHSLRISMLTNRLNSSVNRIGVV